MYLLVGKTCTCRVDGVWYSLEVADSRYPPPKRAFSGYEEYLFSKVLSTSSIARWILKKFSLL